MRWTSTFSSKLYEGFFQAWYGVEGFGGFMIWEWGSDGGRAGILAGRKAGREGAARVAAEGVAEAECERKGLRKWKRDPHLDLKFEI